MSTLAFIITPQTPIPDEGDRVWFRSIKHWEREAGAHWNTLHGRLDGAQQQWLPSELPALSLHGTIHMTPGYDGEPVAANARAWAEARIEQCLAGGLGEPVPRLDPVVSSRSLGVAPSPAIENLLQFRSSALRAVPRSKLKRGGGMGWIANAASIHEFDVFGHGTPERSALRVLTHVHGGDALLLVTYGHALMVERICSPAPGVEPSVGTPWTVRLAPLTGVRDGSALHSLRALLDGSPVQPDFAAIERELAAPEISVARFFSAFGLSGARELTPPDTAAVWRAFDQAGAALLAGRAPDKTALSTANSVLAESDARLPGKPGKPGKGDMARDLAWTRLALRDLLPVPDEPRWQARERFAEQIWSLEHSPAGRRLAPGHDKKGFGSSAATARLLAACEPRSCVTDPLALAALSLACEDANWHGFVVPLQKLAETLPLTGLTAAVFAADKRDSLRQAIELDAPEDEPGTVLAGPWAAEVFLDSPAMLKADVHAMLVAWIRKNKVSGALARIGCEGNASVAYFIDGEEGASAAQVGLPEPDMAALAQSVRSLDARAVPVALGAGDLLDPGDVSAHVAAPRDDATSAQRRTVDALVARLPAPVEVTDWINPLEALGGELRFRFVIRPDRLLALRVAVPGASTEQFALLQLDLRSPEVVGNGQLWSPAVGELRADMGQDFDPGLLGMLLGDTPDGTTVGVAIDGAQLHHYVMRRA